MKMKFPSTISVLSIAIAAAGSVQVQAEDAFYEALSSGKSNLDVRLRYEGVDEDNVKDDAKALTVRTRLGYKTGELLKTTAFVEMEDVRVVGGMDDYNGVDDPNPDYSTVADPRSTELNQAYLSIKPIAGMDIIGGRQRLILDNARFVGNVGWRQNEQTFDALTFKYKASGLDATAAYIHQVNGIIEKFDAPSASILANVAYSIDGAGKISGYYYGLENRKTEATLDTYGARFSGSAALADKHKIIYSAEYATQETTDGDNEADYSLFELGYGYGGYSLIAGMEVLGSDDGNYGFQTPLATKHAFNGWADIWLATPSDGLEDMYLKGVAKAAGMKFVLAYHDYAGDDSGDDLGTEINFVAVKPFAKKYTVGFKYAAYSATDASEALAKVDTDKVWLWGEMKF